MNNHIEELANKIRNADLAYYNTGETLLEDAAYDALKDELQRLAPDHELLKTVGAAPPEMLAKVPHSIPMGSLDKAMNKDEFTAWIENKGLQHQLLTASLKMDGGSLSLEYKNGRLARAVTRGDGLVGEDITANAQQFKNCPQTGVKIEGKPFTGFVRAEIILLTEDWKKIDPDLVSNPRNRGNGIARRKDGEQASLLNIYAFRAHFEDGSTIAASEADMLAALTKAGFAVAPWHRGNANDAWNFYKENQLARPTLPYWIDGVVVKLDDIPTQTALGEHDQRPKGQIALKFPAEGAPTVLRSVELTVGHTGTIIPTGKFDPVQLGGTTVSSALLCNWEIIRALDIALGDTITVYKAGDIIPKIKEVTQRTANRIPIDQPATCPICGGPAGHKKNVHGEASTMLYCLNDDCPAKLSGKIDRYIRSLNILGIGDEVLDALCKQDETNPNPLLRSPAGLYLLKNYQKQLAGILMGGKTRLGEKRAKKILDEIEAKRELTLAEFLGSLGIEGLGKRRVALIQEAVPGQLDTLDDWLAGKLGNPELAERAGVPNIGPILNEALIGKKHLIAEFLTNGVTIKTTQKQNIRTDAKSFCFTGASSVPRKELQALVRSKGHIVKDDVSAGLTYLVLADPNSTSSKAVKARKLGTQCISETEFRDIMAAA
jgi:DNA ligase (NAD+)